MPRVQPVRLAALVTALLASGCSLLGLDDFGAEPCRTDADCAAANTAAGIDAAGQCLAYRCDVESGLCEQRPRDADGDEALDRDLCADLELDAALDCDDHDRDRSPDQPEQCDGIDNDCDQVIDEGVWPEQEPATVRTGDPQDFALGLGPDGTALIALGQAADGRSSGLIVRAQPSAVFENDSACDLTGNCNFAQAALTTRDALVVALGINRTSCMDGQARVGVGLVGSAGYQLGLRDPLVSSELRGGVDLAGARLCTTTEGACEGAHNPAVALLPPAGNGRERDALALWLAREQGCEDSAKNPVQRFALVGMGLRANADATTLRGVPDVHSHRLWAGLTVDQRPALLGFADGASGRAGHLIAHVDERGPLLLYVPRVGAAPVLEATQAASLDDPSASQVVFAALPEQDLDGLALAWRSQDEGKPVIRFAGLQLDADAGDDVRLLVRGEVITQPLAGQLLSGPALAYAPEGFRTEDPAGGWLLLWSERALDGAGRLLAVRVPEAKPEPIAQPEELASGELAHIFVYPRRAKVQLREHAVLRYGFVHGSTLSIGEASCLPR